MLWGGLLLSGCAAKPTPPAGVDQEPGAASHAGRDEPVRARGIASCRSLGEAAPDWMAGCWRGQKGTQITLERWQRDETGALRGHSETSRAGEVIHRESMTIKHYDKSYRFIASPQGQPTAVFSATALGPSCIDFRNPEHDYPQLIGYRRNNDTLTAFIAGHKDGKHQQMIWKWQRRECD